METQTLFKFLEDPQSAEDGHGCRQFALVKSKRANCWGGGRIICLNRSLETIEVMQNRLMRGILDTRTVGSNIRS